MADLAVGDIIKSITDDVKLLVRDEVQLAKAELVMILDICRFPLREMRWRDACPWS